MKFKNLLNENKNKTKIKLLQDLTPLMFKLSNLRNAKKIGDIEIVNNTQLGNLNYQKIKFIKEEDCGSDSAPPESTFSDSDIAKGPGDRIGGKKKIFKKKLINEDNSNKIVTLAWGQKKDILQ